MFIKNLHLTHFRNHEDTKSTFEENINCLVGKNGSGKTNLLDGIYYLCIGRGAFSYTDTQHLQHGKTFFSLKGIFDKEGRTNTVQCIVEKGKAKVIKLNNKPYPKISEHVGNFPCVLLAPNDTDLIRESSELRRNFFDTIISQIHKNYIQLLIKQKLILRQRNQLLKDADQQEKFLKKDVLEIYDEQLLPIFKEIHRFRTEFIQEFMPIFSEIYHSLADEEMKINYRSHLEEEENRKSKKENPTFESIFKGNMLKDLILQRTEKGTHRDDYKFLLGKKTLKHYGSQGQQKSFVIALKLATFAIIYKQTQIKPILLLDDIFDKLDETRIKNLLKLLSKSDFGQVFVTDARPERTRKLLDSFGRPIAFFEVKDGSISSNL
ncbi:DNA replication and repair protein RecF [Bernardetia litoralis DSM 6794]|uniref:DNA replication and repair protein RecF n=1 Tax=Bernardetia litoralis (strain ATCC 23117 / DSM 6794 / NBRC 15988 / NCIMB 1366 / Fx l1 / Sio-4) TaxID=880071 RepID=I4AG60_BERLS|nr:DNA replication and repair protein RecF [Bernardetia litoralis]AFM02945.1 DNA replication and repair protein RecF [Bernardetia litoralis DSM 6794]